MKLSQLYVHVSLCLKDIILSFNQQDSWPKTKSICNDTAKQIGQFETAIRFGPIKGLSQPVDVALWFKPSSSKELLLCVPTTWLLQQYTHAAMLNVPVNDSFYVSSDPRIESKCAKKTLFFILWPTTLLLVIIHVVVIFPDLMYNDILHRTQLSKLTDLTSISSQWE